MTKPSFCAKAAVFAALATLAQAELATPAQAEGAQIFNFDDAAWRSSSFDGVETAILWGSVEDETAVQAIRYQPGAVIPQHVHTNGYWGISVQGRWIHIDADGQEAIHGQEAYAYVPGGDFHGDSCAGPEVCINIVYFQGANDIIFPR